MRELSCKNMPRCENNFKRHYYCVWSPTCLKVPKCLTSVGKMKNRLFPQNQDSYNPGKKSLGQYCNIHFFLSFLGFLLKQCILFENFLQFSLPSPYTKLKLGKNSGYSRPTLFVGRGKGVDLCELETPQKCKSVSRLLSMIVDKHSYPRALYFNLKIQIKCMYMCL